MCSSTLLTTRLDILESVTKNMGLRETLENKQKKKKKKIKNKKKKTKKKKKQKKKKKKNAEYSGESVHNEVINLTEAKLRDLELANKEFSEQARQERMATSNTSTINYYAEDADAMYMSA